MMIVVREGGLYKTLGHSIHALVHNTINPCELWHRRVAHLHYRALPGLQKMVTGMPEFSYEHMMVFVDVVLLERMPRIPFLTVVADLERFWI